MGVMSDSEKMRSNRNFTIFPVDLPPIVLGAVDKEGMLEIIIFDYNFCRALHVSK